MTGNAYLNLELRRNGQRLAWGELLASEEESCATFGGSFDVPVRLGSESDEVQYFSGLLLKFRTDLEGIQMVLELYDLIDSGSSPHSDTSQVLIFHSAVRLPQGFMPVAGEDWMQLTEVYSLHFLDIRWL